jgi:poly-beta-1,6-N-acetyl-D-glucosamine synthase
MSKKIMVKSAIKFVAITPARNEDDFIQRTIDSVISQTLLPMEWVIINDGSTDRTAIIVEKAARLHSWIKVVNRYDRGFRELGVGLVDVIRDGISSIGLTDYEFLFNIDADIWLPPNYFEDILTEFRNNPLLGIAAGVLYESDNGTLCKLRIQPEMVFGAIKCWRRKCFEEIGGLVRGLGHEAIDCFKAMMMGWETKTFDEEKLQAIHLKPMKSSIQNRCRGWVRHAEGQYFMGSHPVWILASALYHMGDRPYIIGGICLIIGYLKSLICQSSQYDNREFRNYLQRWQLHKLFTLLRL